MAPDGKKTRESFEALAEIALAINSLHDSESVLQKVLAIAMDALDAERGFIVLISDRHRDGFEIQHQKNFTDEQLGEVTRISRTAVDEVLRSGEPLLIYEAQEDDRFGSTESILVEQIQSIACVPLRIKENQVGAIYIDSRTRRSRFTRDHLPFLTAFANQAAVAIENARLYGYLRSENRRLTTEVQRLRGFEEIVGQSPRMKDIFTTLSRVANSDATVLIEGESGTGKELIARALHSNSERANKDLVTIFCGSLPDGLLESELFGHKKGAFTGAVTDKKGLFEAADGGTIFLDEIGDLSARTQQSLLRVLQEGEVKRVGDTQMRTVDVRVVSATNKPLKELMKTGDFREDLYYRLNTITIEMPALRHRRGDVPLLAHHFLDRYSTRKKSGIKGFTPEAIDAMVAYSWPGNVRELENTVERGVVLAQSEFVTKEDLLLPDHENSDPFEPEITIKDAERRVVLRTLAAHDGNVSETARVLDVSRRWLHYRLKEWDTLDE